MSEWVGVGMGRKMGACVRGRLYGLLLTDIRLEEVGAHAGDVTNIVTHVVGNHSRVVRVVLIYVLLDLADEIGADVAAFVDVAATRAEGDGEAPKPKFARHCMTFAGSSKVQEIV